MGQAFAEHPWPARLHNAALYGQFFEGRRTGECGRLGSGEPPDRVTVKLTESMLPISADVIALTYPECKYP